MSTNHRSIRGKSVNMTEIRNVYAQTKSIGNANMNARGDYLDNSGNIIKYRHEIISEYHKNNNGNSVRHVSLKDQIKDNLSSIPVVSLEQAAGQVESSKKEKTSRKLVDKED